MRRWFLMSLFVGAAGALVGCSQPEIKVSVQGTTTTQEKKDSQQAKKGAWVEVNGVKMWVEQTDEGTGKTTEGVKGTPGLFLVDAKGNIVYRRSGGDAPEKVEAALREKLNLPATAK